MAVYKPYKKTSSGKEEIKIPYSSIDGTPTIPTVNNGTLTIQKNGTKVQTFTANQSSSVTANITVPTKASDVNALSLDGGTINKSKTVKMDASANSDGANLKWGTVNSKNPYIGYASDQVDGTFVVGSLLGTNFASGLAIGGGSGNLLWKGTKVATINDIPDVPTLAKVATTGSYNDLSNKPTIPTVYDDTLTIKQNGTTVQIFSANQSGNVTADIIFHLYEHNIYLSCSNTTSTVAPSRAYIYFTIITTDSRALNWTRLNNILRTAERNAGGYGYIGDLEGNNKSFNASVQKIEAFNTNTIYVTMVYNNSLLGIDNTYDGVTFYSNYVTITDTVRTIL